MLYFTDDTFHLLPKVNSYTTIYTMEISNITLPGLGDIEQGFDETDMQSISVIMCSA